MYNLNELNDFITQSVKDAIESENDYEATRYLLECEINEILDDLYYNTILQVIKILRDEYEIYPEDPIRDYAVIYGMSIFEDETEE